MFTLMAVQKSIAKSGNTFYKLLCSDTYESRDHMAGTPFKIVACSEYVINKALGNDPSYINITKEALQRVIGKNVYVMYNEQGYTAFIRFYDDDEKKRNNASAPQYAPSYTVEEAEDIAL